MKRMNDNTGRMINQKNRDVENILEKKRKRRKGARVSSVLAILVVVFTVGSLVLPARTLTSTSPDPAPDTSAVTQTADTSVNGGQEEGITGQTDSVPQSVDSEISDNESSLENWPAQNFEESLDTLNVSVAADEGALPAETTMELAPVQDIDALYDAASGVVESEFNTSIRYLEAIDIGFYNNGNEIEPSQPVRVSLFSDQLAEGADPVILHQAKDGQMEILKPAADIDPGNLADNQIVFDTVSFSSYLLAYLNEPATQDEMANAASELAGEQATGVNEENAEPAANGESAEAIGSGDNEELSENAIAESGDTVGAPDSAVQKPAVMQEESANVETGAEGAEIVSDGNAEGSTFFEVPKEEESSNESATEEEETASSDKSAAADSDGSDSVTDNNNEEIQKTELSIRSVISDALSQISIDYLTADGETYRVTVAYNEKAGIPEGSELRVKEIISGSDEYEMLLENADEALQNTDKDTYVHKASFYDIKILDGEKEIEPDSDVSVSIIKKGETIEPITGNKNGTQVIPTEMILHYDQDEPSILNVTECRIIDNGVRVVFRTDSFSNYGSIQSGYMCIIQPGDTVTLNSDYEGGTWAVTGNTPVGGSYVTITPNQGGNIAVATAGSSYGISTITHTYTDPRTGEEETETYKVRVAQAQDPQTITTVTNDEANIVRMRLIDLDKLQKLDKEGNQGQNAPYNSGNGGFNVGINQNHPFKFVGWGAAADNHYGLMNQYTGQDSDSEAYKPRFNIVKNDLSGGYPVLNNPNGTSLKYIFDDNNIGSKDSFDKWAYENAEGLFKEENGMYVYDSNTNYAYYDERSGSFSVYANTYYQQASSRKAVGFFPFNPVTDAIYRHTNYSGQVDWTNSTIDSRNSGATNFNSGTYKLPDRYYLNPNRGANGGYNNGGSAGYWNHHLGINMAVDFNVTKDGLNSDGEQTVFEFSGDDDMWVFVDGKLALDIGGVHQPISGSINFATGDVFAQITQSGTMQSMTNIFDIFPKEDFVDLDKPHRLEIFYLERGGCDSNCKISFNMKKQPPKYGTIHFTKMAPNQTPVPGATFQLFYDEACTQPLRRTVQTETAIHAGFDIGDYDYERQDVTAISDDNGWVRFPKVLTGTYYMKEVGVPEGYWADGKVYEVVIGEDSRVEAGAELKNEDPDPYTTINGAESTASKFNVENKRVIIDINKTDNAGTSLAGASFDVSYSPLTGSTHSAKTLTNLQVNESGVLTLDGTLFLEDGSQLDSKNDTYGLPNGTYTVTEKNAPDGYDQNNLPSFTFTVENGELTQTQTVDGVTYQHGSDSASFNVVNTLPEGKLGVKKTWLDINDKPMEYNGSLDLTLVQSVRQGHHVIVNYYCKGNDGNGGGNDSQRYFIAKREGYGQGNLKFSWTWNGTTTDTYGMNETTISINPSSNYTCRRINGNGGDTGKTREVEVQNVSKDLEITVLIGNYRYAGTNDSLISQLSFSGSGSGNNDQYTEVSRRPCVLG